MKALNQGLMALALLGALAGFSSCKIDRGKYVKGADTIYCDEGFKNVMEEEIEVFEYSYPGSNIIPSYVSEGEAIDALMGDTTSTIVVTRELTPAEIQLIKSKYNRVVKQQDIAVDAVVLIVNKDNPIKMLSVEEVGQIIKGDITKWSQLLLNNDSDIKIVFDNANSSTVMYMRNRFLNGNSISSNPKVKVFAEKSNRDVFDVVRQDPSALGIISVSWLGDSLEMAKKVPVETRVKDYNAENDTIALDKKLTTEVKVVPIQNPVAGNQHTITPFYPYQENIYNAYEYPFVRKVYMITTESSGNLMKSFYDFVTGTVGQKIMMNTGILPARIHKRVVELK